MKLADLPAAVLAQVRAGRRVAASIVVALRDAPVPLHTDVEAVREVLAALYASGQVQREVRRDPKTGRESLRYYPLETVLPKRNRSGPALKPLAEHRRYVLVSLPPAELAALDAYAAAEGTSRSGAIVRLVRRARTSNAEGETIPAPAPIAPVTLDRAGAALARPNSNGSHVLARVQEHLDNLARFGVSPLPRKS